VLVVALLQLQLAELAFGRASLSLLALARLLEVRVLPKIREHACLLASLLESASAFISTSLRARDALA